MTQANLTLLANPRSPAAEAYRALRTNLMFYSVDNPLSALVLTAPVPGAGTSAVAANLAVALAQGGHDTVLVDCDLRQPAQHTLWDVTNEHGLTDMLLQDQALNNPTLHDVGVEKLRVLTSGSLPPNPADVIGSRRMDEVITALKDRVEYVIFDAPPVLAVTDAALLSLKTDGVLLVLRAGSSRRDHAARAKEELDRVNVRLIGSVLANAPRDTAVGGY